MSIYWPSPIPRTFQPALNAYAQSVKKGGTVVVDPDMVRASSQGSSWIIRVCATRNARELGSRSLANMIMLGALIRVIKVIPEQAAVQALKETVRSEELDSNLRALEIGLEAVELIAAKVKIGRGRSKTRTIHQYQRSMTSMRAERAESLVV